MQAEQLLVAPSQAGLRLTRLDLVNHKDVPIDCIASYPTYWIYKRNGHENINCPRSCFTSSPNLPGVSFTVRSKHASHCFARSIVNLLLHDFLADSVGQNLEKRVLYWFCQSYDGLLSCWIDNSEWELCLLKRALGALYIPKIGDKIDGRRSRLSGNGNR